MTQELLRCNDAHSTLEALMLRGDSPTEQAQAQLFFYSTCVFRRTHSWRRKGARFLSPEMRNLGTSGVHMSVECYVPRIPSTGMLGQKDESGCTSADVLVTVSDFQDLRSFFLPTDKNHVARWNSHMQSWYR